MTRQLAIWMTVSLFSFFCISTNQPFFFFDDGTIPYSMGMISGLVLTSFSSAKPLSS